MGIAEKIYEVVKDLPEREAEEILGFAEHVKARHVTVIAARRHIDIEILRRYRGVYDGNEINRELLHDRAGIR